MSAANPMSGVIAVGYMGLTAPDLDAWRTFAVDLLGMQENPQEGSDALFLRIDEKAWRFKVSQGPKGGMEFLGLEVANATTMRELVAKLEADGQVVKEDTALAKERGVFGLWTVTDPGGNLVELYHGGNTPKKPFVSPTGARFVAGDLGLGHGVISFPDLEEAKHFYIDLLGFRVSDTIGTTHFTHCNPRHHSIGLAQHGPNRPGPMGLGHFMVQVDDIDVVGRAYDRVLAGEAPLTSTLGKHTNDRMISFYTAAPCGLRVEYGFGGRMVDDATWTTAHYDAASIWGHQRQSTSSSAAAPAAATKA